MNDRPEETGHETQNFRAKINSFRWTLYSAALFHWRHLLFFKQEEKKEKKSRKSLLTETWDEILGRLGRQNLEFRDIHAGWTWRKINPERNKTELGSPIPWFMFPLKECAICWAAQKLEEEMPSTKQCPVLWKDEQRSWKNNKDRKKKMESRALYGEGALINI